MAYRKAWYEQRKEQIRQARINSPWKEPIIAAKSRAKKKGVPCDLTEAWAQKRWTGFCELTGLPFSVISKRTNMFSPSLDRRIPTLGYLQSNCRFILQAVNMLKSDGTDENMFKIVSALHLKNTTESTT